MRRITVFLLVVILYSCNQDIDTSYIKSKWWNYSSGFRVGRDFIFFDKKTNIYDLKGDTIYYKGEPKALIKSLDKKRFTMKVSSLDGEQKGTYISREESLQ